MTPISSSNRACNPSNAVLLVDERVGTAVPARTIQTGPIRLPLESPATFVQHWAKNNGQCRSFDQQGFNLRLRE